MKSVIPLMSLAALVAAQDGAFGIMNELTWMQSSGTERDEPYDPEEAFLIDEEYFFDHVLAQGGDRLLSDKPWFIDFYAPWCIHC